MKINLKPQSGCFDWKKKFVWPFVHHYYCYLGFKAFRWPQYLLPFWGKLLCLCLIEYLKYLTQIFKGIWRPHETSQTRENGSNFFWIAFSQTWKKLLNIRRTRSIFWRGRKALSGYENGQMCTHADEWTPKIFQMKVHLWLQMAQFFSGPSRLDFHKGTGVVSQATFLPITFTYDPL